MAAWFRLSLVFSIAGLLASRMGLLVHEFAGHGGLAYLLGGKIPHWRLFIFGGGWIQYEREPWYSAAQLFAISLAGVGGELIVVALLWGIASRLGSVAQAIARIAALLLCAHTCVYIATGAHYGYGDGMLLHSYLSPTWRLLLVLTLSLAMASMAYLLTKQALVLAATLEVVGGPRRLFWVSLAIVIATGLHSGLYFGERALVDQDETYEALMQREVERRAERYLVTLAAQQELAGQPWTADQEAQAHDQFVEKHEPWPLRPLLVALGFLAAAVGSWRYQRTESDKRVPWRWSAVRAPAALLLLAMLAIVVIDAFG